MTAAAPCNGFRATHQDQLTFRWGGRYGGANCTACSAGMAGQVHTCGAMLFTGAQIRAASDEPIPDPRSPGLNLAQIDVALFRLSHGAIDLDTHYRYPFESAKKRLLDGAQAVLQIRRSVLVARGEGHGNGFPGGHAVLGGVDAGTPFIDDPLTGRFPTSWATLEAATGALVLGDSGEICGRGLAYVSFTRDVTVDYQVSIHPRAGDIRRTFGLYEVHNRTVLDAHEAHTKGLSASAEQPRIFTYPGHTSQRLVVLTSGMYAGMAVRETYAEAA